MKYSELLLLCIVTETVGFGIIGFQESRSLAPKRSDSDCEGLEALARVHAHAFAIQNKSNSQLSDERAFKCHMSNASVAHETHEKDDSDATCSPVCAENLDIVVVLGSSEWSLDENSASYLRRSSIDLLKHFDLSRSRGSLFGFLDVSRGVKNTQVLIPLNDKRNELVTMLESWKPNLGGKAVTNLEMQGFEHRSEVLSMLNISRASARSTLLVMPLPQKDSGFLQSSRRNAGPFARDREIMEMLVSACPAIRIDPSMPCGRMRWGSDATDDEKVKPWGSI